jgi:hypothetical protein
LRAIISSPTFFRIAWRSKIGDCDPEDRREANREAISKVIAAHLATLKWPVGYKPAKPQFILETLDDMRAKDWVESQPIDWNFISRSA